MAHEGLAVFLIVLGFLLLFGYILGPRNEVRLIKRKEGQMMLLSSAALLFAIAAIVYSGILG